MQNNIEEDLKLFNKLANDFLKEEKLKPLSNYIKPEDLYDKIDLTLDDKPAIDNDFKKTLHQLILSTPKSSSNTVNAIVFFLATSGLLPSMSNKN